jgi:hypothetical protein
MNTPLSCPKCYPNKCRCRLHTGEPDRAHKNVRWVLPDGEKEYYEHLKDSIKAKRLEQAGWTATNVIYKYNTHGFRGEELEYTSDKSIMFLGCSHIFGTGINYEDTMAYHVSKSLGYKCYNLSLVGSSINTLFSYALHWIPKLKPNIVVVMQPHQLRIGWFCGLKWLNENDKSEVGEWLKVTPTTVHGGPYDHSAYNKNMFEFYMSWTSRRINSNLNMESNTLAIKQICSENDAKFYKFSGEELFSTKKVDEARDLVHAGKQTNINAANLILDAINKD